MQTAVVRISFLFFVMIFASVCVEGQQRFILRASGTQVSPQNSSTRYIIATLMVMPPFQPGMAANLVFQGRGGTSFPAGTTAFITGGQTTQIGFPPDAPWFISFDVNAANLALVRRNGWGVVVNTPDFPGGEVRGSFHLVNGPYNDHDGDGRTDLQVYRTSNNTFYAMHSANRALVEQQLGQPGDSVSLTVDWDADAISDFSTADYEERIIWRVLPSRTNVLDEQWWGASTHGDIFAAGDYDGDGLMDHGVFRAGAWHILLSASNTYRQEYWGIAGDFPVLADFDRDNRTDVSIARNESGQRVWYTRLSTNGTWRVTPWGLSSDAVFTGRADFDGDALPDLTVIRNESGQRVFYILRSSDSQMQVIQWGLSSDVVKLGDYDGDGKTDPAVTRAVGPDRVFYILQSLTATARIEVFGQPGDF